MSKISFEISQDNDGHFVFCLDLNVLITSDNGHM